MHSSFYACWTFIWMTSLYGFYQTPSIAITICSLFFNLLILLLNFVTVLLSYLLIHFSSHITLWYPYLPFSSTGNISPYSRIWCLNLVWVWLISLTPYYPHPLIWCGTYQCEGSHFILCCPSVSLIYLYMVVFQKYVSLTHLHVVIILESHIFRHPIWLWSAPECYYVSPTAVLPVLLVTITYII